MENKIKHLEVIAMTIILILIGVCFYIMKLQLNEYSVSEDEYIKLAELAISKSTLNQSINKIRNNKYFNTDSGNAVIPNANSVSAMNLSAKEPLLSYDVDFSYLQNVNPDTIAWITLPNTECNYPVMQGVDNNEYIKTTFYGTTNSAGSIFIDSKCSSDFSDLNTIIYGHNMKNGSMFHNINNYKDVSFYKKNPYFYIMTPGKQEVYTVVAAFETTPDSFVYTTDFQEPRTFYDFLGEVTRHSNYSTISCDTSKPVITLSTCTGLNGNNRFVVILQKL